jgi:hypothetical protein
VALAIQQEVCWFDVSVHDVTDMHERDRKQGVVNDFDQMVFSKVDLMFH